MTRIVKATVRSYDSGAGTAEIEVIGSHGKYLTVPVATHLDGSVVADGNRCAVIFFDEHDQGDAVLIATYDDTFGMGAGPLEDHDHSGDTGDGGQFDAANLSSGSSTDGQVLTSDGAAGAAWESLPALADHDHSGDAGDGGTLEADLVLKATGDSSDKVLRPDGSNGVMWQGLPDHDHDASDDGSGGFLNASVLVASGITDGYVLTADGSNGCGWEEAPAASDESWTWGEWSSTSWDGDGKGTGDNGIIDLSAVFGLPAGIKAISARLAMRDDSTSSYCYIAKDSDNSVYGIVARSVVANAIIENHGIIECDSNGDIYFATGSTLDNVYLYINGYLS